MRYQGKIYRPGPTEGKVAKFGSLSEKNVIIHVSSIKVLFR